MKYPPFTDFMLSLFAGLALAVCGCAFIWAGLSFVKLEFVNPNNPIMRGTFFGLAAYGTIAALGK